MSFRSFSLHDLQVFPLTTNRWSDLERLFGERGGLRRVLVYVVEADSITIRAAKGRRK